MSNYAPRNDHEPGFIYLIEAQGSNNLYKIGLTRNPDRRLQQLNSSQSPFHLNFIKVIQVQDMASSETTLHKQFSAYATDKNEWFQFTQGVLQQVAAEMDYLSHKPRPVVDYGYDSPFSFLANFEEWGPNIFKGALILIGVGLVASVFAPKPPHYCTATAPLNVRRSASADAPIVAEPVLAGQKVRQIGEADGWIQIGNGGWVSGNHLSCGGGE